MQKKIANACISEEEISRIKDVIRSIIRMDSFFFSQKCPFRLSSSCAINIVKQSALLYNIVENNILHIYAVKQYENLKA